MGTVLSESDFQPLSACAFQHWDQRSGPALARVRPLTEDAARRVWRRAQEMCAAEWMHGPETDRFDLRNEHWDAQIVRDWLLSREPERELDVIVCFQPQCAISVPWGALCDHWLTLLWTGGCAWPASEQWVLIHDGDQFAFGKRRTK